MSQITFASDASPSNVDLDANFTELYDLRNKITTPSYAAGTPYAYIGSTGNWAFGGSSSSPAQKVTVSDVNPTNGYVLSVSNSRSTAGRTGTYVLFDAPSLSDWKIGIPADVNAFSIFDVVAGVERFQIDGSGNMLPRVQTTPPTLSVNGQMVFNLTSNTNLRISVRGSDGTTRVANITLA